MANAQYVHVITRFYSYRPELQPEEAWYVAVANNENQAKQMIAELHKNARPDSDEDLDNVSYTKCDYEPDGIMAKIDDMVYRITPKIIGDAS